jgi:hypothetical protein
MIHSFDTSFTNSILKEKKNILFNSNMANEIFILKAKSEMSCNVLRLDRKLDFNIKGNFGILI